ncbi:hypothetical protein BCIN_05g05420 [Botrytis cinerea B05.10]|uniref:Uncharacterized protein n=1 Tax=Botryotinia fuckeliana (strain B05.10) TaxID=332648 RepID=A0A384JHV6_BOTFB|nr:hypothetical protein BCIN_05g05420 [Botrytis cinerea B05.10]ATZ50168.1 hypothetical protein BCIN_05g05420 [Botrytis cinerea B05.10]
MKGFIRASLLVAVGAAGLAQGYQYEARGLSDIIAALEGGAKGKESAAPAVTKEITKTMTVTKSVQGAAAPTGAAIQAAGTGGQFSFLTSTVFASGAPPTVTVTPLPQMVTQTVTETEQVMVTMMATQMSVVTSMVTMTMMQTTTVMVSVTMQGAAPAASISTSLTEAAIQGATVTSVTTSAAIQAGGSPAPALGAAQVAQPNPVDINTFSLSSSLVLGNLAVATAV